MMNEYKSIACRYHEIATKGHNRSMFEERLVANIRMLASYDGIEDLTVQRMRGRIFIRKKKNMAFTPEELENIKKMLSRAYGIESFSPVLETAPELDNILDLASKCASSLIEKMLEKKQSITFRSRARRSDKSFPLKSKELEIEIAKRLWGIFGEKLKIDLTSPDVSVGVEVRDKIALVYYETFKGPGGLPAGCNGNVLALLSGGIDSPVACGMTMKRGCNVEFLTFHSYPYTPAESLEKVKNIASRLNLYQKKGRLFACNLSELQKLIRDNCNPRFRTVLYRRMMFRIAEMVCHRYRLGAIVTGDAVGQVASQTLVNMSVINDVTKMLVLRPVCGMDKLETIDRAVELGTYDLSIIDLPDSCTVFAPDSPAVAAKYYLVEAEEKKIPDLEKALEETFRNIERFDDL